MDKRPTISFPERYTKLLVDGKPTRTAVLLLCLPVSRDQILHQPFMMYETNGDGVHRIKYDESYILLVFSKENGEIFTSLRTSGKVDRFRFRKTKYTYYSELVGLEFKVLINENSNQSNNG